MSVNCLSSTRNKIPIIDIYFRVRCLWICIFPFNTIKGIFVLNPDRLILNVKTDEFYCTQDLCEESLASFK